MHLAVEARGAALNQGNISRQRHPVDMSSCIEIIERIENDAELLKPRHCELAVLDVGMVCNDVDFGVEFAGRFFRNLLPC